MKNVDQIIDRARQLRPLLSGKERMEVERFLEAYEKGDIDLADLFDLANLVEENDIYNKHSHDTIRGRMG